MQSTRSLPDRFLGRTYLVAAILSGFVSLSFFNTVLVADEVFVVFSFGPEFLSEPWKIVWLALSSSWYGWLSGRFISPLSHILSNTGVFLNEVTANVLSINQIQAYSLWRVVMLVAITLSTMKLIHALLVGLQINQKTLSLVMAFASVIIPSGFVTNSAFSAIRIQTWAYGILTLVAIWIIIALITLAIMRQETPKSRRYVNIYVAIVALLFATTYELTQALAPVALLISNYLFWAQERVGKSHLEKLKSTLFSRFNLTFIIFFSIPFLVIRIDSFNKCAVGCYQTASLNPGGFSLEGFLSRVASSFPPIAQAGGFRNETDWLASISNSAALFAAIALGLSAVFWLFSTLRKTKFHALDSSETIKLSILGVVGIGIILMISVGMAFSVELQRGRLPFWESSRDSLILSIGTSLVLCYLVSFGVIQIIKCNRISSLARNLAVGIVALLLSLNFALTFVSNTIVTRATQNGAGAFMQSALASAVSHPDTTLEGDQIRCALIVQKIMNFPEWEGHDRMLVDGLNTSSRKRIGVDFCSRSIDELFANYPLKR